MMFASHEQRTFHLRSLVLTSTSFKLRMVVNRSNALEAAILLTAVSSTGFMTQMAKCVNPSLIRIDSINPMCVGLYLEYEFLPEHELLSVALYYACAW